MEHLGTRILETTRILLRKIEEFDYQAMYDSWASQEECSKFFPWSEANSIELYKKKVSTWIDNYSDDLYFNWIIELKETKEIIGIINLHNVDDLNQSAETSYILTPKYWGNGFMTEVLKRVLKYAFEELGINRVDSEVFWGNLGSEKVLLKAGMKKEGIMREKYYKNGSYIDAVQYAILRKEWIYL